MHPKVFNLEVTEQEIMIIGTALDELPRKLSNNLVVKLQQQVNEQLNPVEASSEEGVA